MWFIQFIDDASSKQVATTLLDGCKTQVGYRGGRVLRPANQPGKESWRAQVFFDDDRNLIGKEDGSTSWLPDGCRRVFIPTSMFQLMGIEG